MYQRGVQHRLPATGATQLPDVLPPAHAPERTAIGTSDEWQSRKAGTGTHGASPHTRGTGSTDRAPRGEATLETLEHGDVVVDGGEDYVVVGTFSYREEQDTWSLHVLDAGTKTRLLEIKARTGPTQALLFDVVEDAPVHGQLGDGLTFRGRPFTLEARGDAWVTPSGDTGTRTARTLLRYTRYRGPGGAALVVETEGTTRRAFHGEALPTATLQIYPHA